MNSMAKTQMPEQSTPLPRSNLGDSVYTVLWNRILDRRLHPGEKLSDLRLSDELGVSRTPVREALQRLVQDGIVRAEPNRGFYVSSFSAQDVAEIYELRAGLEVLALQAAAARIEPDQLHHALTDLNEVEARIATAGTEHEQLAAFAFLLEVDRGFHRWLIEQAGNRRLTATVEGLWAQIAVFQKAGTLLPGLNELTIRQHRRIIAALLDGRVEEAAQALRRHILDVGERVRVDLAARLEASSDDVR